MRSAGSQALDEEETGRSGRMDDTVTRNEGKAVKRLLHSKDNKRPNGGKDFHMKGGSSIDRRASAVTVTVQPARRLRPREFSHLADAPSVNCCTASVVPRVTSWLWSWHPDSMCTRAFVYLNHNIGTCVPPHRSKSGQLLDGALTAGSVQHTAHKERLAVDVPKCEALVSAVVVCTMHLHASLTDWKLLEPARALCTTQMSMRRRQTSRGPKVWTRRYGKLSLSQARCRSMLRHTSPHPRRHMG